MLVLASCAGGTPPGSALPADPAGPGNPSPAPAGGDPGPVPEPDNAAEAPARPARTEMTVHVEQVEVTLPFALIHAPELGFSTYLFEDFALAASDGPLPGIRVDHPDPDRRTFIEVTAYPGGTTAEAALAALYAAADDDDAWVQPGVPVRPWAVDSVLVDHGDHVDVYFLLEHDGRYLLMRQHFAWAEAEALAPVLEGFLNEWLWDDGRYLLPRD